MEYMQIATFVMIVDFDLFQLYSLLHPNYIHYTLMKRSIIDTVLSISQYTMLRERDPGNSKHSLDDRSLFRFLRVSYEYGQSQANIVCQRWPHCAYFYVMR
jgi:hypothetical protein